MNLPPVQSFHDDVERRRTLNDEICAFIGTPQFSLQSLRFTDAASNLVLSNSTEYTELVGINVGDNQFVPTVEIKLKVIRKVAVKLNLHNCSSMSKGEVCLEIVTSWKASNNNNNNNNNGGSIETNDNEDVIDGDIELQEEDNNNGMYFGGINNDASEKKRGLSFILYWVIFLVPLAHMLGHIFWEVKSSFVEYGSSCLALQLLPRPPQSILNQTFINNSVNQTLITNNICAENACGSGMSTIPHNDLILSLLHIITSIEQRVIGTEKIQERIEQRLIATDMSQEHHRALNEHWHKVLEKHHVQLANQQFMLECFVLGVIAVNFCLGFILYRKVRMSSQILLERIHASNETDMRATLREIPNVVRAAFDGNRE